MSTDSNISRLEALFKGPSTHYGQYVVGPDGVEKVKAYTKKETVPRSAWVAHVRGNPGLGISPLTEGGNCYFGAIDWDDEVDLVDLERRVQDMEFPLVVCRSKSGGAHLYVFLIAPVTAELMREKLSAWATALNITNQTKSHKLEIFPKQEGDALGNWINLPYAGGDDTNRYAVRAGNRLTLSEFLDHAESMRVTDTRFRIYHTTDPNVLFTDGPPCLQTLHSQGVSDMRNITLTNMAVYLRLKFPDAWAEKLHEYNEKHVDPPLDEGEVDTIINSVDGKEYWYQCKQEPLCSNCKEKSCLQRDFGIGAFKTQQSGKELPNIEKLTWIKADPARWRLLVEGQQVEVSTQDLMMFYRFRHVVMDRLGIFIPSVKQNVWERVVQEMMLNRMTVEPPREVSVAGRFMRLLAEFAEMRKHASSLADLRRNKPVEEDGELVFRYEALEQHLAQARFNDWESTDIWSRLKALGAETTRVTVDKKTLRVWRVPVGVVADHEDTDDIDGPVPADGEPTF